MLVQNYWNTRLINLAKFTYLSTCVLHYVWSTCAILRRNNFSFSIVLLKLVRRTDQFNQFDQVTPVWLIATDIFGDENHENVVT